MPAIRNPHLIFSGLLSVAANLVDQGLRDSHALQIIRI